jgi:type IV pilus assembly protein PilW
MTLTTLLRTRSQRAAQRGMSLIELLVAMAIGLVMSLAIFGVLAVSEGLKRTTTSVNDIDQAGNYAMYTIDKWVRSAGSGFAQGAAYAFGCTVHASKSTTQILPATSAPPAPFAAVNTNFRLAPILIAPGAASDVLIVMAGSAGFGETPVDFSEDSAASALTLTNTVSFKANDVVLVADMQGTSTMTPCMVQQVTAVAGKTLNLGGAYASATIGSQSLTAMPRESTTINLGNIVGNNPPSFLMIGVGADNTLFSYDLLQTTATPLLPIATSVVEMHALYGVDNDDNGTIDAWVDPSSSATYAVTALMAGDATANGLLQSIKAVRVGLITRTSLPEKDTVAPATLTLFSDLGATYTRTLTSDERLFRHRTIESTIPIRNAMLLD